MKYNGFVLSCLRATLARQGATRRTLWYISGRMPTRQNPIMFSTLPLLVCGQLFREFGSILSSSDHSNDGYFLMLNPDSPPVAEIQAWKRESVVMVLANLSQSEWLFIPHRVPPRSFKGICSGPHSLYQPTDWKRCFSPNSLSLMDLLKSVLPMFQTWAESNSIYFRGLSVNRVLECYDEQNHTNIFICCGILNFGFHVRDVTPIDIST